MLREGEVHHGGALTDRAIARGRSNGHLLRRSVSYNADEILTLGPQGEELRRAADDYKEAESVSHYWCTCGEENMDHGEAVEHLKDARGDR